MENILVTGASGQLGLCIKDVVKHSKYQNIRFEFLSSKDLDVTNKDHVIAAFKKGKFTHCINCAAYTQVDKAESDALAAENVNVIGAQNLAKACQLFKVTLLHISTDFVFDGNTDVPYVETDTCNPLGVYGETKLKGELEITERLKEHFIIRTSWLYSEHANNFMKTMLRLGNERSSLSVVADQIGKPTYARDLAGFVLNIIEQKNAAYGIYHFSNDGETSWYGFASEIFLLSNTNVELAAISTEAYPTPAKRPKYSVLNTNKAKETFGLKIENWKESLARALANLKSLNC
ncbi:NAD(P)-dependent oxidoreductase [Croceivirga lutea]|uniref:dTDP-4-dehydrorhamnose reductase n=1 Tax=Croceivirga lutea TaxID=1775167 RepID=UPI001639F717|nr:dTDP-4-dehydrorhamnose reductase [Croceivirga lutea]GGG42010.1 NAD(P)-dependent oxidoreductase [Croceivirga lutea]